MKLGAKRIELTNLLSISVFLTSLIMASVFAFVPNSDISSRILLFSWPLLLPSILIYYKKKDTAKITLSWILPIVIMIISILGKMRNLEVGNTDMISFFDVRMLLLVSVVIPFSIIGLDQIKLLIPAAIPSFISIVFFDPIHNYLGIGFYDLGLIDSDYYIFANFFTIVTYIFIAIAIIGLKKENHERTSIERKKSMRLARHLDQLVNLSRSKELHEGDVKKSIDIILKLASESLIVSRISIWNYNHDEQLIECVRILEGKKYKDDNSVLHHKDYPSYFSELESQKILIANDTSKHKGLKELNDYLISNDIKSLLDTPFYKEGQIGGIICIENQEYRDWSLEDTIFVKALSDFLSYAYITNQLNTQYKVIKEKNKEIEIINSQLEQRISERTSELKLKNEQLSEYAFINSHKLRGPIARIEGLLNVMELDENGKNVPNEIMAPFKTSIKELDLVSRQINKAIEHFGTSVKHNPVRDKEIKVK